MRLPNTRADEHFFFSRWQPTVWGSLSLGVLRVLLWGPWPFVSLTLGSLWREKPRALQFYLGIKCDGTQTSLYPPYYVMVLTLKELAACRIHGVDHCPVSNNQGGA